MQIYGSLEVFCYISQSECLSPDGVARIFLPPYAAAGIQTHVSRVAPTWDLLKGALPTEFRVTYFWPVLSLGLVDQLPSRWVHLLCQAVKLVSSQPYGVQKKKPNDIFRTFICECWQLKRNSSIRTSSSRLEFLLTKVNSEAFQNISFFAERKIAALPLWPASAQLADCWTLKVVVTGSIMTFSI